MDSTNVSVSKLTPKHEDVSIKRSNRAHFDAAELHDDAYDAGNRLGSTRSNAAAAKSAASDGEPEMNKSGNSNGADKQQFDGNRRGSIRTVLATIEAAEEELRMLDAYEDGMDERLRLYGDVINLRKESAVLKEDAARARSFVSIADDAASNLDPAIEQELAALEEEAQRSSVQQVWANECRRSPISDVGDMSTWSKVKIENISERLRAARKKFRGAEQMAASLYDLQNNRMRENKKKLEKTKQSLYKSVEGEMEKLVETHMRLKQTDADQRFHIRRGTNMKEPQGLSQKFLESYSLSVHVDEAKQFGDALALNNELKYLTEHVKQCKRVLVDTKRANAEAEKKLEKELHEVEESGKEARDLRAFFERENEELKELKQGIQPLLRMVRAREREAFIKA